MLKHQVIDDTFLVVYSIHQHYPIDITFQCKSAFFSIVSALPTKAIWGLHRCMHLFCTDDFGVSTTAKRWKRPQLSSWFIIRCITSKCLTILPMTTEDLISVVKNFSSRTAAVPAKSWFRLSLTFLLYVCKWFHCFLSYMYAVHFIWSLLPLTPFLGVYGSHRLTPC